MLKERTSDIVIHPLKKTIDHCPKMFTLVGFVVVIFVMGLTLRRFCRHGISRGQHCVNLRRYEEIQLSSLVDICEVQQLHAFYFRLPL